ncbi:hypothetical protein [Pseudomonas brassicacearum]|uniref:hypothetical protein n=1 Tax=Pseudomonas brassicacearum TaxID=930166 RepID=UPI0011F2EE2F|nr:hypothetical protein [Pseudomonas brassicacearum]QEO79862.1 hypothetical protein ELZ14_20725 [Pseudomonas brassicacearum]
MTIDKQKLQKLLWAEVAAWSVSAPDWPTVTQALEEFLGKQTLEEVALELLVENEALREASDKLTRRSEMLEQNVQVMTETHVLYTWLREKVDQPSNDLVAVQMNIGHDWVLAQDLDRDLRTMIDREEP